MSSIIVKTKYLNRFEKKEDNMTFSVFKLLRYLPEKQLKSILSNCLNVKESDFGELESFDFWVNWNVDDLPTVDGQRKVPDGFITFEKLDIILEVKLPDKEQFKGQWKNEIKAYHYNLPNRGIAVLWALGGNFPKMIEFDKVKILKSSWIDFANIIKKELRRLDKKQDSSKGVEQILIDILAAVKYYGRQPFAWFEEPIFIQPIETPISSKSLKITQLWKTH